MASDVGGDRMDRTCPPTGSVIGARAYLLSMLKVGCIGFGGGSALIPVMAKEICSPRALSSEEFAQDVVIGNVTPGALPVKLAALAGTRLRGAGVALLGALAVALPGTAGTVGLLVLFGVIGQAAVGVLEAASFGISAFILFLLAHYVKSVLTSHGRLRPAAVIVALLSFLATGAGRSWRMICDCVGVEDSFAIPELSVLALILVALLAISALTLWQVRGRRRGGEAVEPAAEEAGRPHDPLLRRRGWRAVLVFVVVVLAGFAVVGALLPQAASFLAVILVSTLSSFGGGEAYVGVADGLFVASGLVDAAAFYGQIVPLANALPGPILVKIVAAVAWEVGGAWGAGAASLITVAAVLVSVGACCACAAVFLVGYERLGNSRLLRNVSAHMLPVICGLLASTAVSLLHSNVRVAGDSGVSGVVALGLSIALAATVPAIRRLTRIPDVVIIVVFGIISALALA